MTLEEQLAELKTGLETALEKKNKADIALEIKSFEAKVAEFEKEAKGLFDAEIKAIKEDFEAKSKTMQDHLDKLDIRIKGAGSIERTAEQKSFNENLTETIEQFAEQIKGHKKGHPELKMEMKAVGDMSIGVNFPGATPWIQEVSNRLIETPYNRVWLADILPGGTSSSNSIIYPKENGSEGAAALWDPTANVDKAQMDYDLTSQSAFFKWIAGFVIVEREMLDDIPWLTSYLQNKMLVSLKTAENAFILNGSTDTNPVQGMLAAATLYDGTFTAPVDRLIDSGWGQISEDTFDFYSPTHSILTPRDAVALGLNKATGSGEYDLPLGRDAFSVPAVPIVKTTEIGTGNFLTFDRNALTFVRRLQPELRMFEDAALAKRNKVMFRIEERATLAIFNNKAIVKGTLAPTT